MIRKRTSKLLRLQPASQPESPASSRPPSRIVSPSPRTLVMSNADLWTDEQTDPEPVFEPSFSQIVEENEPLFHDSFLSQSYEAKEPSFMARVARFEPQKQVVRFERFEEDLSSVDEYEDEDTLGDLDDFDTESITSEASVAVSVTVYNLGRPKLVDISPFASTTDLDSPYIHSRQLSTSSRSSSNYSDQRFGHHSASSSLSDCTRLSQPTTPMTPVEKSPQRSSLHRIDIPPRSHSKQFHPTKTYDTNISTFNLDESLHDLYADDYRLLWSFPSIPGAFRD